MTWWNTAPPYNGPWATGYGPSAAPAASATGSSFGAYVGPAMAAIGAIQSAIGAYQSVQSVKSNLEFQAEMAEINSRMAERTAQSILRAGEWEQGRTSLRAGKVKSAQRASQGKRGIQMGVGSAAEEIATTDLMKETDRFTINANAVQQAWAARMQSVNFGNESLLKGASASTASPWMAAGSSLLGSGASVASSWYSVLKDSKTNLSWNSLFSGMGK